MKVNRVLNYLPKGLLVAASLSIAGCIFDDDSSSNNPSPTTPTSSSIISPKNNQNITYNTVTMEVDSENNVTVTATNSTISGRPDTSGRIAAKEIEGVENGEKFYIYNIPLEKGENEITVTLVKGNGTTEVEKITVFSDGDTSLPVSITADKREGIGQLDTKITIQSSLSVDTFMLDEESDGVVDSSKDSPLFDVSYSSEGRYLPVATVKTSDGIVYSSQKGLTFDVKAALTEQKIDQITEQITDVEKIGDYIFALSATGIYKISESDTSNIETISIPGAVDSQGLCYDNQENLYIVDGTGSKVTKLLKSSGYQVDTSISYAGSFGTQGSGQGEFYNPLDCMIDSTKDDEKIFVVDNGNNRIQIFNKVGVYIGEFDGSNTSNGVLNSPEGIVASSALPIVSDTGNNIIRSFTSSGEELDFSPNGMLSSPKKIASGINGYIIADSGNNRLVILTRDFQKELLELPLSGSPLSAISFADGNDNYYLSFVGSSSLEKQSTNTDAQDSNPEDITKLFVEALLEKDQTAMELLAADQKVVSDISEDIDAWITFLSDNDIKEYNTYSKDNLIAGVEILFKNTSDRFFVNLIKINNTWYVKNF